MTTPSNHALCAPWRVVWPDGTETGFRRRIDAANALLDGVTGGAGAVSLQELGRDGFWSVLEGRVHRTNGTKQNTEGRQV